MSRALRCGAALALVVLAGQAQAQDQEDLLKPFLAEMAPGPQSAHEMLGIAPGAVTNLQSPKDWLGVVSAGNGGSKSAFGLAFSPGRSDIRALAVPIRSYAQRDNWGARLWGATTLSLARNVKAYGGADYRQTAFFVQTTYYWDADEDPVVAGYRGIERCVDDKKIGEELNLALMAELKAERKARGGVLGDAEIEKLERELAERKPAIGALLKRGNAATRLCAGAAVKVAGEKWNATRIGLSIGKGWIEGVAAGSPRLSLGQHLSLDAALAPKGWDDSLFSITVRRARQEVDLKALAGTPTYSGRTQAAVRYTHNAGTARNVYALAEVSTDRSGAVTASSSSFRQALGIDYKVGNGLWLELRWGRARTADGSGLQSRALMNLKFSPESGVAKLAGL